MLVCDITGATPLGDPHFIETLEGSFSAVSTATIARLGSFYSIFRDLQDLHTFAPLQTQKISKNSFENFEFFPSKLANFTDFQFNFIIFRTDFDEKNSGFDQISRNLQNFIEFANLK